MAISNCTSGEFSNGKTGGNLQRFTSEVGPFEQRISLGFIDGFAEDSAADCVWSMDIPNEKILVVYVHTFQVRILFTNSTVSLLDLKFNRYTFF